MNNKKFNIEKRIIAHFNFFQIREGDKVDNLWDIPSGILDYLLILDDQTINRPTNYILSKRKLSASQISNLFGVSKDTILKIRKITKTA